MKKRGRGKSKGTIARIRTPKLKPGQTKRIRKVITRRSGNKARVKRNVHEFSKKTFITKKSDFKDVVDKKLKSRVTQFWSKNRETKGRKKLYLFKARIGITVRGKRIQTALSLRTKRIRSKKSLDAFFKEFTSRFEELLTKYLSRKDAKTVTLKGYDLEALEEIGEKGLRSKSPKTKRRKK